MADPVDRDLISLASAALYSVPPNRDNHTVASAARSRSGLTFVGVNVHHFTGGPCAELVVLGTAVAGGVLAEDITTIVAVARDEAAGKIVVINPCGKCRQVLLDYNEEVDVIVVDGKGGETVVRVQELLPYAFVRIDKVTGRRKGVSKG